MPYKANEPRRHKIPKARYRVENRAAYDAVLRRRGDLTIWATPDAVRRASARSLPGSGWPGRQRWKVGPLATSPQHIRQSAHVHAVRMIAGLRRWEPRLDQAVPVIT